MIHVDTRIARLCAAEEGIVTRQQLLASGVTDDQIRERHERRLLREVHQGVYRHAASAFTESSRLLAACRAAGPTAVVSHRSAARLRGLRGVPPSSPEITVVGSRLPLRSGLILHRTNALEPVDVTTVDGVPATTVARTLLDLGAVLPFELVQQAAQDALIRHLVVDADLLSVLERIGGRGRRGTASLRAVIVAGTPPEELESRLELDLFGLIVRSGVPSPELQYEAEVAGGRRVRLDFAWPARKIAVEADGVRWHGTTKDLEHHRSRVRAITAAGWAHYAYGWDGVHHHADDVVAELRQVVTRAG